MAKFWELLEQSIIVQSLLTLMLVSVVCYLWITGKPVPQELLQLVFVIVAYWMGTKAQHVIDVKTRKQL